MGINHKDSNLRPVWSIQRHLCQANELLYRHIRAGKTPPLPVSCSRMNDNFDWWRNNCCVVQLGASFLMTVFILISMFVVFGNRDFWSCNKLMAKLWFQGHYSQKNGFLDKKSANNVLKVLADLIDTPHRCGFALWGEWLRGCVLRIDIRFS